MRILLRILRRILPPEDLPKICTEDLKGLLLRICYVYMDFSEDFTKNFTKDFNGIILQILLGISLTILLRILLGKDFTNDFSRFYCPK